jgi:hypothetical protein
MILLIVLLINRKERPLLSRLANFKNRSTNLKKSKANQIIWLKQVVDTIGSYPPPVYTSSICLLAILAILALSNS